MKHARWLLMVAAWTSGCDGATPPDDGGASTRATVRGDVTYGGSADGSLLVGIFDWDEAHPSMPMGPPLEFVAVDAPAFPEPYELRSIRPGAYFVGAVLDVGRDSPTLPGPEDLEVYGERFELVAGEERVIELALRDD